MHFQSTCSLVVTIIGLIVFIKVEKGKEIVLIDFAVFKNKAIYWCDCFQLLTKCDCWYTCCCKYVCTSRSRFNSFQSGMLSLGYLVAVLAMIRVGEKILQKVGAK